MPVMKKGKPDSAKPIPQATETTPVVAKLHFGGARVKTIREVEQPQK